MDIYIPTLGRESQTTYNSLPDSIRKHVTFVVNHGAMLPQESERSIVVPYEYSRNRIAGVRQYLLEHSSDTFVMLDDDLVFYRRRQDDPTRFEDATSEDIEHMFYELRNFLISFPLVGIGAREGGNVVTDEYVYNTRILRVLGYNAPVLKSRGIRFDRVPVMEDFDVALQLLRSGYDIAMLNWIVSNQKSSNAAGGCSTYRTLELQREAALKLAELHPEFVTVVEKQTKKAWNGQTRTDVRIAWKKARGN